MEVEILTFRLTALCTNLVPAKAIDKMGGERLYEVVAVLKFIDNRKPVKNCAEMRQNNVHSTGVKSQKSHCTGN